MSEENSSLVLKNPSQVPSPTNFTQRENPRSKVVADSSALNDPLQLEPHVPSMVENILLVCEIFVYHIFVTSLKKNFSNHYLFIFMFYTSILNSLHVSVWYTCAKFRWVPRWIVRV